MEIKYVNVNFKNGFADRVPTVTQYDYGQHLRITGLSLPEAVEFHFKNQKSEETLLVAGITTDGITTVQIPNSMLKEPHNITAYIYLSDGESGKTVYRIDLNMRVRNAPQEFPTDPDDEHYVSGVSELIAEAAAAATLAKESLQEANNAKEVCLSAAAATQALCDTLQPADAHYDKESWTAQSGVAVSEAIKELKTELSSSSLYANALRGEQEDKMLVIDDVSPIEHNVEFSVRSKNLICKEPRNATIDGISYVYNEDEFVIALEGTATGETPYMIVSNEPSERIKLEKGVYTLSGNTTNGALAVELYDSAEDNTAIKVYSCVDGVPVTFAVGKEKYASVYYKPVIESVLTGYALRPMLEHGKAVTDYMPGAELSSSVMLYLKGKNLYNMAYLVENGVATFLDASVGEHQFARSPVQYPIYIPAQPNTAYCVSGYVKSVATGQEIRISCYYKDGTKMTFTVPFVANEYVRFEEMTDADKTLSHIVIGETGATITGACFKEMQVEKGVAASEYSSYFNMEVPIAEEGGRFTFPSGAFKEGFTATVSMGQFNVKCNYIRDINKAFADNTEVL
ncbi:MAG: BppU family phage baseplate upper protein [Clostridia bacterium]|nr:BppU family phage baseplate upper protein [Clostridia bacterium]